MVKEFIVVEKWEEDNLNAYWTVTCIYIYIYIYICNQYKVCEMSIIMCALYTVSINLGTEICEVTIFIRKTALCGLKNMLSTVLWYMYIPLLEISSKIVWDL